MGGDMGMGWDMGHGYGHGAWTWTRGMDMWVMDMAHLGEEVVALSKRRDASAQS